MPGHEHGADDGIVQPPHPLSVDGQDVAMLVGYVGDLSHGAIIAGQSSRRSEAHRVSSWRLDSWSLRNTLETCVSTVLIEMKSVAATSL